MSDVPGFKGLPHSCGLGVVTGSTSRRGKYRGTSAQVCAFPAAAGRSRPLASNLSQKSRMVRWSLPLLPLGPAGVTVIA